MFNQYSYKQKFQALLVLSVLLLITAYKRSFSQLITSYSEYKKMTHKSAEFTTKSKQLQGVAKEVAIMDQLIGKGGKSKEIIQQEIVNFVAKNHPEVTIDNIQPIHSFKDEHFITITNIIDITGNTNQLLKTAYDFEKTFDISKIVSLHFYTSKKNDKEEKLHLKIIFQNYEGI